MPRKIKVLDVIPEDNQIVPVDVDVQDVTEPDQVTETKIKSEEKVEEEVKQEPPEETVKEEAQETVKEAVEEETKHVRKQELHQCPKCQKWLTKKTLTYFHECTKNDTPKAKRRPKKIVVENIKEEEEKPKEEEDSMSQTPPQPKLVRQTNKVNYKPPVQLSYEDMRRQRIQQRIEQRTVKIQNLFATAI